MAVGLWYHEGETIFTGEGMVYTGALYCDQCDGRIEDVRRAVYAHRYANGADEDRVEVLFAHKGDCHDRLERERSLEGWNTLERYLVQLLHNAGGDHLLNQDLFRGDAEDGPSIELVD